MKLEAYLFFPGNTEEAMTFYQGVFGGDLTITRAATSIRRRRDEKHLVINAASTAERSHFGPVTVPTRRSTSRPGSS